METTTHLHAASATPSDDDLHSGGGAALALAYSDCNKSKIMSTPRHVTSKKEIFSTERVFCQDCLKVWVRIARAQASCPEITCTRTAVILQLQPCRINGIHLSESMTVSRITTILALCARGGHRRHVASATFVSCLVFVRGPAGALPSVAYMAQNNGKRHST